MAKKAPSPLADLEAFRRSRGETQTEFWTRFGVTQSGGSRYESGREMPLPTAMLVQAFADGLVDDKVLALLRNRTSNESIKRGMI
jgi:transcriptional regulator with XRE-family HTH domain